MIDRSFLSPRGIFLHVKNYFDKIWTKKIDRLKFVFFFFRWFSNVFAFDFLGNRERVKMLFSPIQI